MDYIIKVVIMKCNCGNCKYFSFVGGDYSIADSGCSLHLDWTKCTIHEQLKPIIEWEGMGQ